LESKYLKKENLEDNEPDLGEKAENKVIEYIPHGLNEKHFYPIKDEAEKAELKKMKANHSLFF
jgi:hypothetical protein